MAGDHLTDFKPSARLRKELGECTGGGGGPEGRGAEWAGCVLSKWTVVYGSGVIARRGDPVRHAVDPDELALCKAPAKEARRLAAPLDDGAGLDTEADLRFHPFFVTANAGD